MAVTVWKGHLTFGLISIPVRLLRAARRERISLHQLHRLEQPGESDDAELPPDSTSAAPPDVAIPSAGRSTWIPAPPTSEPRKADPGPVERVRQGLFAREDQPPIPSEQIVKGYEVVEDRYVVIDR